MYASSKYDIMEIWRKLYKLIRRRVLSLIVLGDPMKKLFYSKI